MSHSFTYFTFSSSSTISSDDESDESLIIEMKNVKSPHDINSYASFILRDESIKAMNSFLLAEENSGRNISNQVPWHVTENYHVIVNMSSFKSRLDITVDSWSWILSKTLAVFIGSIDKSLTYYLLALN